MSAMSKTPRHTECLIIWTVAKSRSPEMSSLWKADQQLLTDVNASQKTLAGLAASTNITSVGQILSTQRGSLTLQDLSTIGNELLTTVDTTGVGYSLAPSQ